MNGVPNTFDILRVTGKSALTLHSNQLNATWSVSCTSSARCSSSPRHDFTGYLCKLFTVTLDSENLCVWSFWQLKYGFFRFKSRTVPQLCPSLSSSKGSIRQAAEKRQKGCQQRHMAQAHTISRFCHGRRKKNTASRLYETSKTHLVLIYHASIFDQCESCFCLLWSKLLV